MAGPSRHGDAPGGASPPARALDLAGRHGAELHHLATMLTGDATSATALVARTLLAAADDGDSAERLQADLVRTYLRTAPRRTERPEPGRPRDAGDLLRTLRPRARAAAALRLVQAWETTAVAPAVGARPARVDALVPTTPGLGDALAAVADQHALTGPELQEALAEAAAARPRDRARGRRTALAAAAVLCLGTLGGSALLPGPAGRSTDADAATPGRAPADLTAAGWGLTDDGEPPRRAMGMQLRDTLTLTAADRARRLVLPPRDGRSHALFAVLWCDLPRDQEPGVEVPSARVAIAGERISIPCAGRDGTPPVTQVVPLPAEGAGRVALTGDLPPGGAATLGLYGEPPPARDTTPPAGDGSADAPPAGDALVVDLTPVQPSLFTGRRVARAVTVGHGSTVTVWAGGTGSVSVRVDGIPVTDDGDLAATQAARRAAEEAWSRGEPVPPDADLPSADWSAQLAGVRDGTWLVHAPDQQLTFDLPEEVRPAPGERRTAIVEVVTEHLHEHLQVSVTDATPARLDTTPLVAELVPAAPELVLGHRLLARWTVPGDGHHRELLLIGGAPPGGDHALALTAFRASQARGWRSGVAIAEQDGGLSPVWLADDRDGALQELRNAWFQQLSPSTSPVSVSVPPLPGLPAATVLAYAPVPYDEFDFAAAAVPPGSWPAGTAPPGSSPFVDYRELATVGSDDVADGRITVDLGNPVSVAARVTTEGRGRLRFLVDGDPVPPLVLSDGWWSSWTDEAVTSELEVQSPGGSDTELTIVVEDYEEFTVELLAGPG